MKIWFLFILPLVLSAAEPFSERRTNMENASPHIEELLAGLVPIREVTEARTPLERQNALLQYFRARKKRPMGYGFRLGKRSKETVAAETLQHRFIGQPDYPLQFRGKAEIDWDTNPFSDNEWIWQFHRFYWLPVLAEFYRKTGDERYAAEWALEIRSWVRHMHSAKCFRKHPGWRELDTALRLKVWAETFADFLPSEYCTGEVLADFLWSVKCHAEYMASLPMQTASNWTIYELESLMTAAAVFPEFRESPQWAGKTLKKAITIQQKVLLPDGVINEYAPSYHVAYPPQFLHFMELEKYLPGETKFPEDYRKRIEKAIQAVMLWSHPDGTNPLFGDTFQSPPGTNRTWMKRFLRHFPERADFRWFATGGKTGTAPQELNYSLPDAGFHVLRSGWGSEDLFCILKNTRTAETPWHNQNDNLTFEFSAFGQRLMTDSGSYIYTGDEAGRQWFRAPLAHQTISIDNREPSGKNARLSARESTPQAESAVLENEPYPGMIHRRTAMLFEKRCLLLIDRVSGPASGVLRQHFQFMPGAWERKGHMLFTRHEGKANLALGSAVMPGITFEEEEGWLSLRYARKEKRPAFAFVQPKAANQTVYYLTVLIPLRPGAPVPEVKIRFADPGCRTVEFTSDRRSRIIPLPSECPTAGKRIGS